MKLLNDQLNRPLDLTETPQRIVCLVPSLTELLVDLGLEKQLVGITKFCVHPAYLKSTKTIIGGTKQVHFNKIKALKPDFILANKEENSPEIVSQLDIDHIVYVSDIKNIDHLFELVKDLGQVFNIQHQAQELLQQISIKFAHFQKQMTSLTKLKVAYFIWRKPWMVAGQSTFINYMLQMCNLDNVYEHLSRYPEVDITKLPDVDYVLLSSEPFPFSEDYFSEIPIDNAQLKIVNGEHFSWYGSRLLLAFDALIKLRTHMKS